MTKITATKFAKSLLLVLFLVLLSAAIYGAAKKGPPPAGAKAFDTPKAAADALVAAAAANDVAALTDILGPDGQDLVNTKDPVADKENDARFVAEAGKAMRGEEHGGERKRERKDGVLPLDHFERGARLGDDSCHGRLKQQFN